MHLDIAKILVSFLRFRDGKGLTQAQRVVRARIGTPDPQPNHSSPPPASEKRMKKWMREGWSMGLTAKILLADS